MRKIVSMSALVSGLLAAPLFAAAKPAGPNDCPRDEAAALEIQAHLEAVNGGAPLEAERMGALHRWMVAGAQARLDRLLTNRLGERLPAPLLLFAADESAGIREMNQRPMEKAAFLGVATSPVTATLRDQLKLQRGMGLVVDFVAPDSPAQLAGLRPHDVLEKLDDQWLINGEQFAVLVRAKKPGDGVTLTVIRGGAPLTLSAKLAEKELPVLEDQDPFRFPQMMPSPFDGSPAWPMGGGVGAGEEEGGQTRKTVATSPDGTVTRTLTDGRNAIALVTSAAGETTLTVKDAGGHELYSGPYTSDADKARVPPEFAERVADLARSRPRITFGDGVGNGQPGVMTMVRSDAQQRIALKVDDKGKSLVVKDAATGKVIFEGPVDTEAEMKALPAGVAEKVKWMEEKMKVGP